MFLALFCEMTDFALCHAFNISTATAVDFPPISAMQLFSLDHFCNAKPKSSQCAIGLINDRGHMFELHKSTVKQQTTYFLVQLVYPFQSLNIGLTMCREACDVQLSIKPPCSTM